jgi:hypothetical protein
MSGIDDLFEENTPVEEETPVEEAPETLIDEQEEEEIYPPRKRKVIGRIPRSHNWAVQVPPPQPMILRAPEYYPANPPQYPQQPQFQQPQRQVQPTRRELVDAAKQQVEYEYMVEAQRQQLMRAQQPRVSTSQKLLNVANAHAGTDRNSPAQICQRTNASLVVRRNPGVSLLPPRGNKKSSEQRINKVIQSIAPKTAKGKSSKRKGFYA